MPEVTATRLVYGPGAVEWVWHVLSQPDILPELPDCYGSIWGFVSMMEAFRAGQATFYVPSDPAGYPMGIVWCATEPDVSRVVAHIAILKHHRGPHTFAAVRAVIEEHRAVIGRKYGIDVFVPRANLQARRVAEHCGFTYHGDTFGDTMDGKRAGYRHYTLEVA